MTEIDYTTDPNSRFQVYPSPVASPGKCGVCGAVDRPVVDFNMTIQFYGAVYICIICMNEAAQKINLVPRSQLEDAQDSLSQSFELNLSNLDLVAIPRAEYNSFVLYLRTALDSAICYGTDNSATVAQARKESDPNLFDFDADSEFSNVGTTEQINDTIVSKRSIKFSSGNSDGPDKFSN